MKSSSSAGPRRPALSELWLSAIVTPWLVVSARSLESTRTRSSDPLVALLPSAAPVPAFGEAFPSVSVLAVTSGRSGFACCVTCGRASPYSPAFDALYGNAAASASVPASLAAAGSPLALGDPRDGPLAVA